ncbi:MAG: hypothetical protein CM15mP115_08620 [Alphaproteobacteria bacterium]|nr:MAG: hypothetical protein CM15mP115_08620 [Alphaproteobacteria bacterium]
MLAVWLIRTFSVDLAEHMARVAAPTTAVRLDPEIRRKLGVGNSTGLGMAPFLINHPRLINSWIAARETALARLRAIGTADDSTIQQFRLLARRAAKNADEWQVADERQMAKIERLRDDFTWIVARADELDTADAMPWDSFYREAEATLSLEGQEALVSLMMEPYGEIVDPLAACMHADEELAHRIDGKATVADTIAAIDAQYDWTGSIDFEAADAQARVWYVSEEKLEPRLGERFEEPLEPYEQPLSPGRDAARMRRDLAAFDGKASLGAFLLQHPEHRHMARRLQQVSRLAYGEIRDNTIAAEMLPIDLLRCKLSFFGRRGSTRVPTAGFGSPCTRAPRSRTNSARWTPTTCSIPSWRTVPHRNELVARRDGCTRAEGRARCRNELGPCRGNGGIGGLAP